MHNEQRYQTESRIEVNVKADTQDPHRQIAFTESRQEVLLRKLSNFRT